jgi:hypothetical protein
LDRDFLFALDVWDFVMRWIFANGVFRFATTVGGVLPPTEGLTFMLIVKINPTTSMAKSKERMVAKMVAILEKMRK